MKTGLKTQRGFSLITAIFLLVVMAGLGAMTVTFFAAQQQSSAIDALGSRAYQAARAGAEWGVFQITQSGVTTDAGAFAAACQLGPTNTLLALPAGTPLWDFSVGISCNATSSVEGANTTWMYNMTASASGVSGVAPGSEDYVEREIQVGAWNQGAIWK